jgi:guanylate kinase
MGCGIFPARREHRGIPMARRAAPRHDGTHRDGGTLDTTDDVSSTRPAGGGNAPARSRGRLFVVSAASGTGKTTLVKALMARVPSLAFSVSHTTRAPRAGEVDGRDYHFVDRATFEQMIAADAFLEHASVFGNLYGTGRAEVDAALAAGRDLLVEIDWQGAAQVRSRLPEAVDVYILPPSRAELEARLRGRGTDSAEVIERRLNESVNELSHWREFRYAVVNDDLARALGDLEAIVAGRGAALETGRPGLPELVTRLLA